MSDADYKLLEIKDFHQLFNLSYFPGRLTSSSCIITITVYFLFSSGAKCCFHWTGTILEHIWTSLLEISRNEDNEANYSCVCGWWRHTIRGGWLRIPYGMYLLCSFPV